MDKCSTYHGVLGRQALKELWAVTSIYHLCMKFPMENGIATIIGVQRSERKYYSISIRKAEPRDVNVILMDIDMDENPKQGQNPEQEEDVKMVEASKEDITLKKGELLKKWLILKI